MAPTSTEIGGNIRNQQKWLVFLRHARTCKPVGGKCRDRNCVTVRKLWRHMDICVEPQCLYPRCRPTKLLVRHYRYCKDPRCPVCVPVKTYFQQHANVRALARLEIGSSTVNKAGVSNDSVRASAGTTHCADTFDNLKLREDMRTLVFNTLQELKLFPADDASKAAKYMDIARRLEEGLFKMAISKEDYVNRSTLESRITSLIEGRQLNNYNQRHANSSSVGTTIPTPGLSQAGGDPNLLVTPSADATTVGNNIITSRAVNSGNLLSAETTMDIEKLFENGDQLETEIAEKNLKSLSLYC